MSKRPGSWLGTSVYIERMMQRSSAQWASCGNNSLITRPLRPWAENVGKRVVKSPKVYLGDSGLFHTLLGLETMRDIERHPKLGASWEGFLVEQVVRRLRARAEECYFWATHAGPEFDLLWMRGRRRWGFEFKRTSAPRTTKSIHGAIEALDLQRVFVVHGGERTFPLHEKVTAVAARRILDDIPRT